MKITVNVTRLALASSRQVRRRAEALVAARARTARRGRPVQSGESERAEAQETRERADDPEER